MAPPPPPPNSNEPRIVLDHLVILVPHSFLALTGVHQSQLDSPSSSSSQTQTALPDGSTTSKTAPLTSQGSQKRPLQDLFTFSPGGRHSDGLTENALVLLPDGVYLEFIAFTPTTSPKDRKRHKWGRCEEGSVVDWAVTVYHHHQDSSSSSDGDDGDGSGAAMTDYENVIMPIASKILDRHGHEGRGEGGGEGKSLPIIPGPFTPGGRRRPDGVELKWAVVPAVRISDGTPATSPLSVPQFSRPGQAPFACLDDTPRRFRVPYKHTDPAFIHHPVTGVVGVAKVGVSPIVGNRLALSGFYDAMFGDGKGVWRVSAPEDDGLHPGGEVHLWHEEDRVDEGSVLVSFFTERDEIVGTRVEAEIEGCGKSLVFEFVGV